MSSRQKSRSRERATKAIVAMKDFGFPVDKAKEVLKCLLKEYENNWEHIEADNYSVFVDTLINKQQEEESTEKKKKPVEDEELPKRKNKKAAEDEDEDMSDEARLVRKKPRRNNQGSPPPAVYDRGSSGGSSSQKSILKEPPSAQISSGGRDLRSSKKNEPVAKRRHEPPENSDIPLLCYSRTSRSAREEPEAIVPLKKPKIEHGLESSSAGNALLEYPQENDRPCNSGEPLIVESIALIPPAPIKVVRIEDRSNSSKRDQSDPGSHRINAAAAGSSRAPDGIHISHDLGSKSEGEKVVSRIDSSSSIIDVASSPNGRVKLSLSFDGGDSNFCMPDFMSILKMVEDKCLKTYKILPPNFSIMHLMNEVCETAAELGESNKETPENVITGSSSLDSLKTSDSQNGEGLAEHALSVLPNIPIENVSTSDTMNDSQNTFPGNGYLDRGSGAGPLALLNDKPHEPALGHERPLHDVNDITKGTERVKISVATEEVAGQCPTSFSYIPENIVYQDGHVNFSLARIGDEDCCSDCFGNCLSSSIPCACARQTGGEYAYDTDGLLKKEFLDDCLSRLYHPQNHHFTHCLDCPIERAKNEVSPEPCKGHLIRKFIKECWAKCGCSMHCGNRVVQRGITHELQVFLTPEGKGWGLRTLEDLPRGAFVCQYVGEVLTNMELYDRTIKTTGNARHTYPVLLDADWGSEGVLKDEEALCLDATFCGNVARFINHRCDDANLVGIPVEIETPDHHYYHLAFFTTRKVEAFEELTWDYGIDFDDHNHPVKAFSCTCGSKFCRSVKTRGSRQRQISC